jgi:hypothetical protein
LGFLAQPRGSTDFSEQNQKPSVSSQLSWTVPC